MRDARVFEGRVTPLLVYLDSADFIDFGNSKRLDVFNKLKTLSSDGRCRFAYSYLHVTETLSPNSKRVLQERQAIGSAIVELCGQNAFPFITDFVDTPGVRDDGYWGPSSALSRLNFDQQIKVQRQKFLENLKAEGRLNRRDFRKLQTDSGLQEWLSKNGFPTSTGDATSRSIGLNIRALYDKRSRIKFEKQLSRALFDPKTYSKIVFSIEQGKDPIRDDIKQREKPLFDGIRDLVSRVQRQKLAIKGFEDQLLTIEASISDIGLEPTLVTTELRNRIKKNKAKIRKIEFEFPPMLSGTDAGLFQYYINTVVRSNTPPKELSQITDIFHLLYHSKCDLIRVDKRTFDAMRGYEPLRDKLVSDINQLPSLIEDRSS